MLNEAPASRAAWYLLAVLIIAYMFAFIDRVMLGLLVDPIRADLEISDTRFSLLAGFSFALFYTLLGVPVGLLVDRRPRLPIIVTGSALWSLATAACGLVSSFAGLFAARMAVGVGEATLSPAASSLLADAFPRRQRGLAMSLYASGVTIGGGLSLVGGGYLVAFAGAAGGAILPLVGAVAGWQLAFILAGVAGLIVPLLLALAREPKRRTIRPVGQPPDSRALAWIRRQRKVIGPIFTGYSLMVIVNYALVIWVPAFLARKHGLSPVEVGLAIGLSLLGPGTIGMLAGGLLADRLTRRGHAHSPVLVVFLSILVQAPLFLGALLVPSTPLAIALLALAAAAVAMNGGVQTATVQVLCPPDLHGRMTAIYLLLANLVGLGLGPTLIALATEQLFGDPARIGDGLALVAALALGAASLLVGTALPAARRLATGLAAPPSAGQ